MVRTALVVLASLLLAAAPAAAQDHVASDGVELAANVKLGGSGQVAAVAGERLIVAGPSHLTVFDISTPDAPAFLGAAPLEAANESEGVITNGKLAAVSLPSCRDAPNGCVAIYDVAGSGNPQRISSVPIAAQIAACVADCRWLWVTGSNAIVDLADPAQPKVVGDFLDGVDVDLQFGCFQAREVRPGLVLVACDPTLLLSTLPEHGGTPAKPVLVARAPHPEFDFFLAGAPHTAHWPRQGRDRFMLTSTETPFHRECTEEIGAFMTWDARPVLALAPGSLYQRIAEWRPQNGTYTDGRSPYNAVGCSPHFIDEHPTFRDGGLVAVAALENGVRLLQVTPAGAIEERGWFLGLGGTAAVPVWHPNGKLLYVADYARGLDVLRYSGETYVPVIGPGATSSPPVAPPRAPRRAFRLAGVQVAARRGSATLAVEVPGPGRLEARSSYRRLRLRRVRARAVQAGLVRLTIAATGRSRRVLARRGRLRVTVLLRFAPEGGGRTQSLSVPVLLRLARRR